MSCPHGEWHEADCAVCVAENSQSAKVAELEREVKRLTLLLDNAEKECESLRQSLPVEETAITRQELIDLLVRCEIVSREALDDAEDYDNGVTSMNVHNFCMMVKRRCDMKLQPSVEPK